MISGLWMSVLAWLVSKSPQKIQKESCDILVLYRREDANNSRLIDILSKKYRVKTTSQIKRPQMIKKRMVARMSWLVPASQYIYASYAWFLVHKFNPKIIITFANGSAVSPFLRAAINERGGYIVHVAHSIPTQNYRSFSLIDMDFYFIYGQSSIRKLQKRPFLFGKTKCIKTGSEQIENKLIFENVVNRNESERAVLLLGCGPKIELSEHIEKLYKLVIDWVLAHPEFKLYFKPHPRSTLELWDSLTMDLDGGTFETVDKLNSDLSHCYAAIAPYTNAVLDVSLLGIPPLWVATKDDHDEFSYEDYFGERAHNERDLSNKLVDHIERIDFYREQAKLFADYHIYQPKQGSTAFMGLMIDKIIRGESTSIDGVMIGK